MVVGWVTSVADDGQTGLQQLGPGYPTQVPDERGNQVARTRRAWLFAVDAHLRAAERHEACARLLAGLGNAHEARHAVERAANERMAHAQAVAQHPDWLS
jgi:hypothetical protein